MDRGPIRSRLVFAVVVLVHLAFGVWLASMWTDFSDGWSPQYTYIQRLAITVLFCTQACLLGVAAAKGPRSWTVRLAGLFFWLWYFGFTLRDWTLFDLLRICLSTSVCVAVALMLLEFFTPMSLGSHPSRVRSRSIGALMSLTLAVGMAAAVVRILVRDRQYVDLLPQILCISAVGVLVACVVSKLPDSKHARRWTIAAAVVVTTLSILVFVLLLGPGHRLALWTCICAAQGSLTLLTLAIIRWYAIPSAPPNRPRD